MANPWYVKLGGKIVGPLTGGQLKRLAVDGKLKPTDLVGGQEDGPFTSAGRVKGLFPSPAENVATPPALAAPPAGPRGAGDGRRSSTARYVPWVAGAMALLAVVSLTVWAVAGKKRAPERQEVVSGPQTNETAQGKGPVPRETSDPSSDSPPVAKETPDLLGDSQPIAKVPPNSPGDSQPVVKALPDPRGELRAFAEWATMEQNSSWEGAALNGGYDHAALTRVKKPMAVNLTDATLRREMDDFARVSLMYYVANQMRNNSSWSAEDYRNLEKGLDIRKDEDFEKYMLRGIGGTAAKVSLFNGSIAMRRDARLRHMQMWQRVLDKVPPTGGGEKTAFPFQIAGAIRLYNVSETTQTNLMVAIKTSSSRDLPADATTHVVFIDRLEPNDCLTCPEILISKLWDSAKKRYVPRNDCFLCSVWSDQAHFENVPFDLKSINQSVNAAISNQFAPGKSFTGRYDTKHIKAVYPKAEKSQATNLTGGIWLGYDFAEDKEVKFKFGAVSGSKVSVVDMSPEPGKVRAFSGSSSEGKIEWEPVTTLTNGSGGPQYWVATNGDQMQIKYGTPGRNPQGEFTLHLLTDGRNKVVVFVKVSASNANEAVERASKQQPAFKATSADSSPDGQSWAVMMVKQTK